ncbi:30S ribosomal protein S15 [Candidatus Saccharibacteria bacterium]|jgi:small subunit ribosomal protein S15|nr:30S ribosomal protein S15 [Candidatus Saccharibacteria bacterium]
MIDQKKKQDIISKHAISKNDVGSIQTQVAVLTARIQELTEHLETNKKDRHARRGLLQMVGRRKRFLAHLKKTDFESYAGLIKSLELRK